jgi:hypothetical protein
MKSGIPKILKKDRQPGQLPYTIAGLGFKTKRDVHLHAQAIHRSLPSVGSVLGGPDQLFMLDLFQHHHNWTAKQGTGVAAIVVRGHG